MQYLRQSSAEQAPAALSFPLCADQTQKPVAVCQNTACTLGRLKSFLHSNECHRQNRSFKERQHTESSSKVYQRRRTKELSGLEWKYPPDDINHRIINPILCLGATDRLHASVTLSNPRVSIRKKKPWNIFLGMVSDARHEIFIIWEHSHNRGGGGMQGFDLQKTEMLKVRWPISPISCHSQIDSDITFLGKKPFQPFNL